MVLFVENMRFRDRNMSQKFHNGFEKANLLYMHSSIDEDSKTKDIVYFTEPRKDAVKNNRVFLEYNLLL